MENILSIDATVEPAIVQVVQIRGDRVQLIESRRVELGLSALEDLAEAVSAEAPAGEQPSASEGGSAAPQAPTPSDAIARTGEAVRSLLASITSPWNGSILIVPAKNYLSLNLDLPFTDARSVNKILNLEVQDLVPFDVGDFLIEHRSLGSHADGNDVHVSIIPVLYLKRLLSACRVGGFEPVIISTPASTLAAVYHLSPFTFTDNSAVLYCRDPYYYLAVQVDGQVRADRILHRSRYPGFEGSVPDDSVKNSLLTEFRLTLGEAEERYRRPIGEVYAFGNTFSPGELQMSLERKVIAGTFSQFLDPASKEGEAELASLAAVFAQDTSPPPILTNFRTREFAYRPQLKELFTGLRKLVPYLAVLAGLALIGIAGGYVLRARYIAKMRDAIRAQVSAALPDTVINEGEELSTLQAERDQLQKQLDALGSQSSLSPLDVLAELSRDIQPSAATFRTISIKGGRIDIEGSAPDYKTITAIENMLKNKKAHGRELYCRIKQDTSNAVSRSGTSRDFTFSIFLCE